METQKYDSPLWIPNDTAKQIVGKDNKCQQLIHIRSQQQLAKSSMILK